MTITEHAGFKVGDRVVLEYDLHHDHRQGMTGTIVEWRIGDQSAGRGPYYAMVQGTGQWSHMYEGVWPTFMRHVDPDPQESYEAI